MKAVIFDFNGTLFRDSEFHNTAWTSFAARHGKSLKPEDLDKHIHGFTNKEIIEYFFERSLSFEEAQPYYEEKEDIYREICRNNPSACKLAPGAEEFLDFLKRRNIPRTIATASYKRNVNFYFELFPLEKWFSAENIILDIGSYRGKPFPDMFLAAAEVLQTAIHQCMIIEDSVGGLNAARNAGAGKIVAISEEGNSEKFGLLSFIDQHINNFEQIDKTWFA